MEAKPAIPLLNGRDRDYGGDREMAELVSVEDGTRWELGDACVIGRTASADVQIANRKVSREHAMIRRSADGFSLYDLDSANGSQVNGVAVRQPVRLQDGDIVRIGALDLIFAESSGSPVKMPEEEEEDETMATLFQVEEVRMAVLVADLKGYTGLSEKLSEAELADLLAPWYRECEEIIERAGGELDKFIGDGVFAYWRNPDLSVCQRVVEAARGLRASPTNLSPEQEQLIESRGIELQCGVGLHSGRAAVGAMSRGNQTALGGAINIAFRIEGLTRKLGSSIVASKAFVSYWEGDEDALFASCGEHELKGCSLPVEVFALAET